MSVVVLRVRRDPVLKRRVMREACSMVGTFCCPGSAQRMVAEVLVVGPRGALIAQR